MAKKEKAPKEKKEKAPKPKKEKKPKVKKEKAPKPKKEKKPKVKKEKPPKPKKEKAPKAKTKAAEGGAEGEEAEEGSGGKKKLLLILLPVVVAVAVTAAFLLPNVLGGIGGNAEETGDDPGKPETSSRTESGEPEGDPAAENGAPEDGADGETDGEADAAPSGGTDDGEIHTGMTTAQVVGYVESLPPASLGLKGDNMSEYDVYASDSIVLVDGRICTQVRVYDDSGVGTNEVQGVFFLSRDGERLLYRYDPETDSVYQMEIDSARYDASSGTVTLTEGTGSED